MRLLAVGDVHPHRDEPDTIFGSVVTELRDADLTFGQLECTLSTRGTLRTDVQNPVHRVPPENIQAFTSAGFDLLTCAGNNQLDYGSEALLDTLELLNSHGISSVGAGKNLEQALAPERMRCGDVTVTFINACSILRAGYAATNSSPGIAPLHISTFYEPIENIYEQPGTPSRTMTVPNLGDLHRLTGMIADAKERSDFVVVSLHWGVHFLHDLATYQADVAYAVIDSGADVVIGTHPHCLQAIEVYRGKPIFYSLGNFAFEVPEHLGREGVSKYLSLYGLPSDSDVPRFPHPSHCRLSIMVKLDVDSDGIQKVSFVPTWFNQHAEVEAPPPGHAVNQRIIGLLSELSKPLGTRLHPSGDEVVVDLSSGNTMDTRHLLRERSISYPSWNRLLAENAAS